MSEPKSEANKQYSLAEAISLVLSQHAPNTYVEPRRIRQLLKSKLGYTTTIYKLKQTLDLHAYDELYEPLAPFMCNGSTWTLNPIGTLEMTPEHAEFEKWIFGQSTKNTMSDEDVCEALLKLNKQ